MTPWELAACVDGYNHAHGGEDFEPPPPSAEEFEAMKERARHFVTKH
jgi:hypothetical protein